MSTFTLDKNIFNPTLYKQVTDVWLQGIDLNGEDLGESNLKNWFTGNKQEKFAFDAICRNNFAHALEAIGPKKLPEPTAQPFLDEIRDVARNDSSANGLEAAWTALSLTLLLDQIPRNIYRTDAGLYDIYTHYDVISYALARAVLSPSAPIPRVDLHPQWRHSAAHVCWFYIPLMHSEIAEAHDFFDAIMSEYAKEVESLEGHGATKMFLKDEIRSEREHRAILDRFGRYPHRNGALGRQSTAEEISFLAEGGATFGVAQGTKDEL
jgi:uncharacterized protein (DUF924 family)